MSLSAAGLLWCRVAGWLCSLSPSLLSFFLSQAGSRFCLCLSPCLQVGLAVGCLAESRERLVEQRSVENTVKPCELGKHKGVQSRHRGKEREQVSWCNDYAGPGPQGRAAELLWWPHSSACPGETRKSWDQSEGKDREQNGGHCGQLATPGSALGISSTSCCESM